MHEHAPVRPSALITTLIVGSALLLGAPALAQDTEGFPVTDPSSGISVTLPAPYQTQEQQIPGTETTIRYSLAVDGDFATSFSVFEASGATGGYDLDGGVQGSADATGGTLVTSTPIEFQGHPGRDFEVAVTDPGTGTEGVVLSRLLWTGEHVVQFQAVGRTSDRARVEELFAGLVASLDLGPLASPGASAPATGGPPGPGASPSVAPGG